MAEVAEANFNRMISTFIRQTRPQSFRNSKPLRYPQRSLATTVTPPTLVGHERDTARWRQHALSGDSSESSTKPRLDKLRSDLESQPFSSFLTDTYAREHNYLRISVTERCNLRCLYCMPEEGVPLSPPAHNLTTPEIVYLSSLFVNQGVNKIRLTGGEPTVRKDILELMRQIGNLRKDGLKELCLTTNGISLHRKLDAMVESGLTGVNLSLDTLDPFQFTIMTRRNGHEAVMKSISRVLEMNAVGAGIKLKINCVVMRGMNEREIVPFVELGREKDIEVRFIEYMPFDGNKWSKNKMLSFQEMLASIREKYPNIQIVEGHLNDTSKTYKIPGFMGKIGFITSMTHNFCGTCNRLRITSDGNLKVCLFGNSEVSLRDILRESNNGQPIDAEAMEAIKAIEMDRRSQGLVDTSGGLNLSAKESQLLEVIGMAVKRKKEKHADALANVSTIHNPSWTYLPNASRLPLLTSRIRQTLNSIPMHSQTPSISTYTQQQYRSLVTRSQNLVNQRFRRVLGQGTHRRIRMVIASDARRQSRIFKSLPRALVGDESKTEPSPDHELRKTVPDTIAQSKANDKSNTANSENADEKGENGDNIEAVKGSGPQIIHKYHSPYDKSLQLSHLTSTGEAHMVNITEKSPTKRSAVAVAWLSFSRSETYRALKAATLHKGDAIAVARIAGIQAAKKTADLIPLAHPGLGLTGVTVEIEAFPPRADLTSEDRARLTKMGVGIKLYLNLPRYGGVITQTIVHCDGKTGVEMEALTAATITALTLYDMLKGHDKGMNIGGAKVVAKVGGKSGDWFLDKNGRRNVIGGPSASATPNNKLKITKVSSADTSESEEQDTGPSGGRFSLTRLRKRYREQQLTKLEQAQQRWLDVRLGHERSKLNHQIRKLKYENEKLNIDKQKISLASTDIDAEIQKALEHEAANNYDYENERSAEEATLVCGTDFAKKRVEHYEEWARNR